MPIRLTAHAVVAAANRGISHDWIERIALAPEWTEPDTVDTALTRGFGTVLEAGGRILRVVYSDRAGERVIVTVHFDRNALRKRPPGTMP